MPSYSNIFQPETSFRTQIVDLENEDKESWQKIYESVKSKNYSDKMTENIVNCAEMLEICNTIEE